MSRVWFMLMFCLSTAANAEAKSQALLIGVSHYQLKGLPELKGPRNDLRLMWDTLRKRGFQATDITVLADEFAQGSDSPDRMLAPTAANILKELDALAARATDGDFVVVYFSGHGTKAPQPRPKDASAYIQPDGFDKILLAIDAKEYDEQKGEVPGGIVGHTLREKFDALRKKAVVWVILDSCHSGGMTRGIEAVGEHFVDPSLLRIPPLPVMPVAPSARIKELPFSTTEWVPQGAGGRLVAFLAAESDRFAIEMPIPEQGGNYFSVFTYNLVKALERSNYGSYRQLANAVVQIHAADTDRLPTPVFEGDLDQPLFDSTGNGPRHWLAELNTTKHELLVQAGRLQGLSDGTILALEDHGKIVGHAEVTKANVSTSIARLVAYKSAIKAAAELSTELSATVVQSPVSFNLKVARPPSADRTNNNASSIAFSAIDKLANSAHQDMPIAWVQAGSTNADVHLRAIGGVLYLVPKSGELVRSGRRTTSAVQIASTVDETAENLRSNLWRLLRQKNLLRIASEMTESKLSQSIEIRLSLIRNADKLTKLAAREEQDCDSVASGGLDAGGSPSPVPIDLVQSSKLRFTQCDQITVDIVNRWNKDVDVTLLYLDSEGGIAAMGFPDKARVPANRSFDAVEFRPPIGIVTWCNPKHELCGYKPSGYASVGTERLLVIIAEAGPSPRTFHYLAQPSLDSAIEEKRSNRSTRGALDSFDELMRSAALYPEQTRGAFEGVGDATMKVFEWEVLPPNALVNRASPPHHQ